MTARKKLLLGAAAVVLLVLVAGGAVFALTRPPEDVSNTERRVRRPSRRSTAVPTPIPTEQPEESKAVDPLRNFVWAGYGYSKDRRQFLPASKLLRPPFRRVWTLPGFGPARVPARDGRGQAVPAQEQRRAARDRQAHRQGRVEAKLGVLAAASPAYGNGRIFVHAALARQGQAGRGLRARRQDRARSSGSGCCPSRSESSPVFDNDRIYFGSENGTVYALRAGDGAVRWTFKAAGRGQGRPRAGQRQALLRRLRRAASTRSARPTAGRSGPPAPGRALRPRLRPVLLDPRGRLRARLHRQHRRPHVLVRVGERQARLDQGHRLLRLLLARRRAGPGREADRLLRLLRRQLLRGRRPHRQGPLDATATAARSPAARRSSATSSTSPTAARRTRPASACAPAARSSAWAAARSTPSSPTAARSS